MKSVFSLFGILLLAATVFAAAPNFSAPVYPRAGNPLDQAWGPDVFGYRAKDSAEPGGPAAQFIDIQATGTRVDGLADDNFVGPFPISWNFRYYWYDVSQFWIGSNGYIKFQAAGNLAQAFPDFPTAAVPNDVIGPYVADWIFGSAEPSRCYYWSNNSDTLIVMFKNVRAWGSGGNVGDHNFEVILSGVDSSFTYQYGISTNQDVSNNDIKVGFENQTGQIGLQMYNAAYPPNTYAIKTAYPDTISYTVHDLGVAGVQNDRSAGFFLVNGDALTPWLAIRNSGNQTEASYIARYSIRQVSNNALIATDDTTMGTITPSEVDDIVFPTLWTAGTPGLFRAVGRVTLTGDINHGNDSVRAEVHVINLPGELFYDDAANDFTGGWSWDGGNGGMAEEFVPPIYPAEVTSVRFWIEANTGAGFNAEIHDDSGVNGAPGAIIWQQNVPNPTPASWATLTVDPPVAIESGKFFVAWYATVAGVGFGMDSTSQQGIARRTWEGASGTWAEFRYSQQADAMIRCTIDLAGNHPPVITNFSPATLDSVALGATVHFTVTATDADNDPLSYEWRLNGNVVGTTPAVDITFNQLGANHVRALVTDGVDVDSVNWNPWVHIIDAAGDPGASMPTQFALYETYPNPFNPTTQIAYDVARETLVSLRIYNLAGEVVSTLVDSRVQPGHYTAVWNAAGQPSGTYFVSFDAGDFHQVTKTLLLK